MPVRREDDRKMEFALLLGHIPDPAVGWGIPMRSPRDSLMKDLDRLKLRDDSAFDTEKGCAANVEP